MSSRSRSFGPLRAPLAISTGLGAVRESKSEAHPKACAWSLDLVRHLIDPLCLHCWGFGRIPDRLQFSPCRCVLQRIFNDVRRRFDSIRQRVDYAVNPVRRSHTSRHCWGMTSEEFLADFTLTARRHLTAHQYLLFRDHILLLKPGVPGEMMQIEITLGRAFAEMRPHSLWPVSAYFGKIRKTKRQHAAERLDGTARLTRTAY